MENFLNNWKVNQSSKGGNQTKKHPRVANEALDNDNRLIWIG